MGFSFLLKGFLSKINIDTYRGQKPPTLIITTELDFSTYQLKRQYQILQILNRFILYVKVKARYINKVELGINDRISCGPRISRLEIEKQMSVPAHFFTVAMFLFHNPLFVFLLQVFQLCLQLMNFCCHLFFTRLQNTGKKLLIQLII